MMKESPLHRFETFNGANKTKLQRFLFPQRDMLQLVTGTHLDGISVFMKENIHSIFSVTLVQNVKRGLIRCHH